MRPTPPHALIVESHRVALVGVAHSRLHSIALTRRRVAEMQRLSEREQLLIWCRCARARMLAEREHRREQQAAAAASRARVVAEQRAAAEWAAIFEPFLVDAERYLSGAPPPDAADADDVGDHPAACPVDAHPASAFVSTAADASAAGEYPVADPVGERRDDAWVQRRVDAHARAAREGRSLRGV